MEDKIRGFITDVPPTDKAPRVAVENILTFVNFTAISGSIGLFGVLANIVNFVIFSSLLALSVSDLGALLTLLWHDVCVNPLITNSYLLPYVPVEYCTFSAGFPHVYFTRATCWITIFITVERCLCITMPFKVKLILKPLRSVFIILIIFLLVFLILFPVVYLGSHRIGWKFYPHINRTLLGLIFTNKGQETERISNAMSFITQMASFIIVIVCTLVLIVEMKRLSKWRNRVTTTKASQSDQLSRRDQRLASMISVLSVILIGCYTPSTLCFLTSCFVPEFNPLRKYENFYAIAWSYVWVFEAINSSVSIFLYYKMSSKYRKTFHEIFCASKYIKNYG